MSDNNEIAGLREAVQQLQANLASALERAEHAEAQLSRQQNAVVLAVAGDVTEVQVPIRHEELMRALFTAFTQVLDPALVKDGRLLECLLDIAAINAVTLGMTPARFQLACGASWKIGFEGVAAVAGDGARADDAETPFGGGVQLALEALEAAIAMGESRQVRSVDLDFLTHALACVRSVETK